MATVKIDKFGGIVPRTHPSLLGDGMAVTAHNCRLKSGKLKPIKQPSYVDANQHTVYHENGLNRISDAKSLFCWKHSVKSNGSLVVRTDFLAFPGDVYFAHGNIADDAYDRIFVTGETGNSWESDTTGVVYTDTPSCYLFDRTNNEIVRHSLCKDTIYAPRCQVVGTLDENQIVYAYFFVTWVDEYGYESPASDPSMNKNSGDTAFSDDPLECNTTCKVQFQPMAIPAQAKKVRIYKSNAGDETDNIQFIKEFGADEFVLLNSTFTIQVDDTQAAEAMPENEAIPTDLRDMTFVPGNFYAGRTPSLPHTILFSDIDNPTNWPIAYRYDIRDNVVKIAVTANTVFALTDGYPYVISGTDPASMTVTSLAGPAACVSEKAVCVFKNAVFFVSNYGLYTIYDDSDAGTVCQCLSDKYFTKDQWQALNPSSCMMSQFDNALHMFFTKADETHVGYIFDLTESTIALTSHDEIALSVCVDNRTDDLYFVREKEA